MARSRRKSKSQLFQDDKIRRGKGLLQANSDRTAGRKKCGKEAEKGAGDEEERGKQIQTKL